MTNEQARSMSGHELNRLSLPGPKAFIRQFMPNSHTVPAFYDFPFEYTIEPSTDAAECLTFVATSKLYDLYYFSATRSTGR